MGKRRRHAEIIAETTERVRAEMISEVCRILRFHCDMPAAAEELWAVMKINGPKRQTREEAQAAISVKIEIRSSGATIPRTISLKNVVNDLRAVVIEAKENLKDPVIYAPVSVPIAVMETLGGSFDADDNTQYMQVFGLNMRPIGKTWLEQAA